MPWGAAAARLFALALGARAATGDEAFTPQLFMTLDDVHDPWGRLLPVANEMRPTTQFGMVAGSFASFRENGTYAAFTSAPDPKAGLFHIARWESPDLAPGSWKRTANVLTTNASFWGDDAPPPHWKPKSMTRDPATGVHTLILYGASPNGAQPGALGNCTAAEAAVTPGLPRGQCLDAAAELGGPPPWHPGPPPPPPGGLGIVCITCTCATVWQSPDGVTPSGFKPLHPPGTCAYHDHDDANLLPETVNGQLANFQIVKQAWPTPLQLQPEMLNVRRVVGPRLSASGGQGTWGAPRSIMLPDEHDPPELEFYQLRAHILGRSKRMVGTALLYAPSPWINEQYASLSDIGCRPAPRNHDCHGPHMHYEYWIAPDPTSGGDVTNASAWRRPFRDTVASTGVFAPALTTDTHHVWASGPTGASALPIYRVAGIRAPANGEFSTREFEYPNEGLWINADAHWTLPPHLQIEEGVADSGPDCKICSKTCFSACFGKHKCDIGCQAYIMAELQDEGGAPLAGFERRSSVMMDVNGTRVPLRWNSTTAQQRQAAVGKRVRLRLFFRDATIFAVGSLAVSG